MNEQEWTDQWVAKLNRLGAEMDQIAASMHPSGWADALAPHWERYRTLAEQHYKPTKPIALQFPIAESQLGQDVVGIRLFNDLTHAASCYTIASMKNKQVNVRLTDDAVQLLIELTKKLGISQAAVLEIAIRRFAENENVQIQTLPPEKE